MSSLKRGRLSLSRETVRELQPHYLERAVGGATTTQILCESTITCGGGGICQTHNCCTNSGSCG